VSSVQEEEARAKVRAEKEAKDKAEKEAREAKEKDKAFPIEEAPPAPPVAPEDRPEAAAANGPVSAHCRLCLHHLSCDGPSHPWIQKLQHFIHKYSYPSVAVRHRSSRALLSPKLQSKSFAPYMCHGKRSWRVAAGAFAHGISLCRQRERRKERMSQQPSVPRRRTAKRMPSQILPQQLSQHRRLLLVMRPIR